MANFRLKVAILLRGDRQEYLNKMATLTLNSPFLPILPQQNVYLKPKIHHSCRSPLNKMAILSIEFAIPAHPPSTRWLS